VLPVWGEKAGQKPESSESISPLPIIVDGVTKEVEFQSLNKEKSQASLQRAGAGKTLKS
jgi:hypothetical protein